LKTNVIVAEHYYNQIKLEDQFNFQYVSIEALIRSSMHTAEVKNIEDQQLWCQNLEATIKNGTGIVLLIDAVDEMKSRDREEFLKHIHFLTANIPGMLVCFMSHLYFSNISPFCRTNW
jgi:hypothetical protein